MKMLEDLMRRGVTVAKHRGTEREAHASKRRLICKANHKSQAKHCASFQ